jgi:methyl-accepting chemotaxis protein
MQTETDLKNELKTYESMFEDNPVPMVTYDLNLDITGCNSSYLELTGYTKDRLLSMNIKDFKYVMIDGQGTADALRTKRRVSGRIDFDFPSGKRIVNTYAIPLIDTTGKISGFLGAYIDITEDIRKNQEIQNYRTKTEKMIDENPSSILVLDEKLNVTSINKAFCRITGYSREEGLRLNLRDFKVLKREGDTSTDVIRDHRVGHGLLTLDAPSGTKFLDEYFIPIEGEGGKIQEMYMLFFDLTKEHKVQDYMTQEIEVLANGFGKLAAGDLTISFELDKPDNDTKEVHDQLKNIHLAVRTVIRNFKINLSAVNKQMEELVSNTEATKTSLQEVANGAQISATNVAKVSSNSEKIGQNVSQVLKAMEDMSAAIEEVTSNMEAASVLAKNTNELSKKGAQKAGKAGESMAKITTSSQNVEVIVNDISKEMSEIVKIVGLIRDLANQTNLLALNAAIEAARAGDAGRGFAVVAAEVKSLAQESRNSAENIEEMIGGLRNKSLEATKAIEEAGRVVEEGTGVIAETLTSFNEIVSAVEKISQNSEEVASAAGEQAATVEEITASVHEVSTLVDGTVKDAGDTAAATEEATASLSKIGTMVENVHRVAIESLNANKKFKIA